MLHPSPGRLSSDLPEAIGPVKVTALSNIWVLGVLSVTLSVPPLWVEMGYVTVYAASRS
jgi:hypothetical protein